MTENISRLKNYELKKEKTKRDTQNNEIKLEENEKVLHHKIPL